MTSWESVRRECVCLHECEGARGVFQSRSLDLVRLSSPCPSQTWLCKGFQTWLTKWGKGCVDCASETKSCCGGMRRPVGALPLLSLVPTPAAWLPAWNQSRTADTAKSGTFRSVAMAVPSAYLGLGRKRRRVFQSVLSPGSKSERRQEAWDE